MRRINLIGDVNTDMVELLFNSLDDLEAESNAPIEVFLCSGGGATNCALAVYRDWETGFPVLYPQ